MRTRFSYLLLSGSLIVAGNSQAADISLNGFTSVVGGMTIDQGTNADGTVDATFEADAPSAGFYDDEITFRPDTVFGLQIVADLGDQLSVTGQITATGGADFDALVSWAYLKYEISDTWSALMGRQRLPLYYYSDFLAVGYAYHWIRPPTEINSAVETLNGVKFVHQGFLGDWDTQFQVYYGEASNYVSGLNADTGLSDVFGLVYQISNDVFELRGTYRNADVYFDVGFLPIQTKDDPVGSDFFGLAAKVTLGNTFFITEATYREIDDPIILNGLSDQSNGFVSVGHRIGDFTPHITYSFQDNTLDNTAFTPASFDGVTEGDSSITLGLRWDFHPSAAFKVEYQSRSDDSDSEVLAVKGNAREVDVFSFGMDVIF